MSRERFFLSFLSFSLGTWTKALLSFITTPVLTYILQPEEFGKASLYSVVYTVCLTVVLLGTSQSYVRFFYEYDEEKRSFLLWNSLWPSLTMTSFLAVLLGIFNKRISKLIVGTEDRWVVLLLIASLYTGVIQIFNLYSIRMKKQGFRYSTLEIVNYVSNFLGTVVFAFVFGKNFYSIVLGQLFANIITFILGVLFEMSYWIPKLPDLTLMKSIVSYGLPFVPTFLLTWLFQSIDRVTLRIYSSFAEIGLYSVAFKLANAMNIIQAGFTTFWVPVAYERYEKFPGDRRFYAKANEIISLLMFTFGSVVILSKDVIFLLVAKTYRSAAQIAPFLVFGPVMYTISETTVVGINFVKKTYWHFIISLVTSLTNVLGNILLVPTYGAKGAAISTGLSYVVFFAMRTYISLKLFEVPYKLKKIHFSTSILAIQSLFATVTSNVWLNMLVGFLAVVHHVVNFSEVFSQELIPLIKGTLAKGLRFFNLVR